MKALQTLFSPIRIDPPKGDGYFSSDTVLQKLCRYIQDVYPSLKQASFTLDEVGVIIFRCCLC